MTMKTKLAGSCLAALIASTGTHAVAQDEQRPQYVVSTHLVLVTDAPRAEITKEQAGADQTSVRRVRIGDTTLSLGQEILWNGKAEWPEESSSFSFLSSPRVTGLNGQRMEIKTTLPMSPQYFEPTGDGTYRFLTLEEEQRPHITFEITPYTAPPDADDNDQVDIAVVLDLVLISHRQPLPGVSFDLGKPVLLTKKISSNMRIRTGYWEMFSCHMAKGIDKESQDLFLVLIKVDRRPSGR
jgi:hypothetical protein